MQKKCSQYDLTRELSSKYSHTTYLASPVGEPERQVVLTLFASSLLRFPHEREKLLQKARSLKELQHRHLVPILDAGIAEDRLFVVREYLPKGSLRHRLKKLAPERLELGEALSIVAQVGEALLYAHQHHIVHGNIKPENILLDANGQAFLTDFSLVDRKDAMIRDQAAEEYAFCYLAPEQFAGTCDSRSDQFALGCLAYELMSGRVPFAAQSLSSMMGDKGYALPAPLSQSVDHLPPSLEVAVLKALAHDPEERFFDFSLFLEVIQAVLSPPPAFPLARSVNASKQKTISDPVASVQTEGIRKRASRRAAAERAEGSATFLSAQDERAQPAETRPIVGASTPEQTEPLSQAESLTSTLQSQLFISSLSLESEPLSTTDNTSPAHPLQGHKESAASERKGEAMPLSQGLTAQLAMDPPIPEEDQDDMWFINPFMQEDPSSLGAIVRSVDEQDEDLAGKMISLAPSSADSLGLIPLSPQRSRKRALQLVLLLSVIVAVTTAGLWFSGLIPFAINPVPNNSQANLRAIPATILAHIPNIRAQTVPTVVANSNPNVENAGYTLIGTNNNYQSNTANAGSNPSAPSAGSNSNAASTNSNPSAGTTGSSPSSTTSTANSDPYPPSGTLALSDPLSDNSRGYGWQEFPPNSLGASCQFIKGSYHVFSQKYYTPCHAASQTSNFTLEVQMQVISGNCGGLSLRDTTSQARAYNFEVCQDGSYRFNRFDNSSDEVTVASGSSGAIVTGLGQSNVIAAVVNGSTFDLYVNHQKIDTVNDSSYSQGEFGVSAFLNTEAAYTNARMWTL